MCQRAPKDSQHERSEGNRGLETPVANAEGVLLDSRGSGCGRPGGWIAHASSGIDFFDNVQWPSALVLSATNSAVFVWSLYRRVGLLIIIFTIIPTSTQLLTSCRHVTNLTDVNLGQCQTFDARGFRRLNSTTTTPTTFDFEREGQGGQWEGV